MNMRFGAVGPVSTAVVLLAAGTMEFIMPVPYTVSWVIGRNPADGREQGRDGMSDNFDKKHLWVLVSGGEITYSVWESSPKEVLNEARISVHDYTSDFLRHDLPVKVDDALKARFDLDVYALPREEQGAPYRVDLPYQEWVDEYYTEMVQSEKEEVFHSFESYLERRDVWEGKPVPPGFAEWAANRRRFRSGDGSGKSTAELLEEHNARSTSNA